jgi:hypothetical protein
MQQEDDLRGLAKVMDFMRAISIVFVVINIYWYCYYAVLEWNINIEVVNNILLNFDRSAGLFGNILYTKLFAVVFLALSCLGTKGVKEEKIIWPKIHVFPDNRFYPVLYELVDFGFTASFNSNSRILYPYHIRWLYLPVNGRIVDEPITQKQYV